MAFTTMTPRQRVQTSLAHEEPEPVPLALGGDPYGLVDDLYLRYCWSGLLPNRPVTRGEDDDTFYDPYVQVWKRALPYYYTGEGILKHASGIDDIESLVR